jgi:hypothetical protein
MKIKRSTFDLWKKRLIVFSGISLTALVFYILFVTSLFSITTYELVGVPDMYKDAVTTKVTEVAQQKIIKILPGNRIFSYKKLAMKEAVVSVLPNTKSVAVIPMGLHTLRIKVESHTPFLRIDDTHAITKEGVVYTELNDIRTLLQLSLATTSVQKTSKEDGVTTVTIEGVTEERLASISSLISKVNSIIFTVSRIDIDSLGDISLYDERGISRVTFAWAQDVEKVWSNLVSAVDTDPLKAKLATHKDALEYLDARFGNKVFFKFTNDTKPVIIQSHATTSQATTTPTH